MTAEIAVISRSAVTLAADSAMTMNVRGVEKIYASADKLFELSLFDPIGAMVFNNLEFMGAPLDVIVKQFRASSFCVSFSKASAVPDAFFEYLIKVWTPEKAVQDQHVSSLVRSLLDALRGDFEARVTVAINNYTAGSSVPDFRAMFLEVINEYTDLCLRNPPSVCFAGMQDSDVVAYHNDEIERAINLSLSKLPMEPSDMGLLKRLAGAFLFHDIYSEHFTGLVFAGFGSSEMFPSLYSYEIDGIIATKLKKRNKHQISKSQGELSAEIIPFAQRDIVDRYLEGMDSEFESEIYNYFDATMKSVGQGLFSGIKGLGKDTKNLISNQLNTLIQSALDDFKNRLVTGLREKFRQQMEDMVLFMPKQDLANLAEALVNITSLKRRFSGDKETVAGPIDVAVISKSDGFVWVKRKHYFDGQLNPRYFVRKFGSTHPQR